MQGEGFGDGSGPGNQTDQPPKNPAARIRRQRTARQFQPFPSQCSRPTAAIRCARKPALLGEVERASQGRFSSPWCLPVLLGRRLTLQLQQSAFEVSLLCDGLMSAPPSRPRQDEGWLNAPLRQADRYAPDFLDRPGNLQAWR